MGLRSSFYSNKNWIKTKMNYRALGLCLALLILFAVSVSNAYGQPNAFSSIVAKVSENQILDENTKLNSQQLLKLKMLLP